MTNVLFTHSYFYKLDEKQWRFKQPYPPLSTLIAAAVIRDQGFEISLFDTNLRTSPDEIVSQLQIFRPKYVVICDDSFNYLTKMCLTVMRDAAFEMTKRAKRFGCTVIVSSSDAADHYEKYLAAGVDYVIKGEVEVTLKELLLTLEKRGDTQMIHGLIFKRFGQTFTTTPRNVTRDLDALPLPAWDLVNIDSYRTVWKKKHGYFSLNLATTRGCPFKCNWCAKPVYGNRYNSRSPENVISEIELLLKNYNPDHFWMSDDIFGLKPGWLNHFHELVVEKSLRFKYKIQSRADLLLEDNTIDALAGSGAETVWIGAESGSQKILDAMDKGTTIEQVRLATSLLKSRGIKVGFFLQFGYPGENEADIDSTMRMLLDLMPDEVGISISYPLPGTKFYDTVKSQLQQKQNWSDSDDLDMMFQGAFNREYYRKLHHHVHHVYRKRRGYLVLKKLFSNPLRLTGRELRSGLATFYYIPSSLATEWRLAKVKKKTPHQELI
jgi:anaerobic magnesium-protoporphyrin IX monomethyl ester cyclase